jgi:ABC-type dipeptide/oligopeptide/nickel transport system ATPase component
VDAGEVVFNGRDLLTMSPRDLRILRGTQITPILPDAKSQLNPVLRIGTVMKAVIRAHEKVSRKDLRTRSLMALKAVSIPDPERCLSAYPHELSGGMAQRVCIALALIINKPILSVADEPTFGLDVTVQRQVLDLIADLARSRKTAQIIVTRDLGIVAHYCDRVAVMQGGRIVETAETKQLFEHPRHPDTRRLLEAVGAKPADTATVRQGP